VARVIHLLRQSRRQVAFFLVTEVAITAIGVPLWVHVLVGGVQHLLLISADRRS
jgi:hypothetical protein